MTESKLSGRRPSPSISIGQNLTGAGEAEAQTGSQRLSIDASREEVEVLLTVKRLPSGVDRGSEGASLGEDVSRSVLVGEELEGLRDTI